MAEVYENCARCQTAHGHHGMAKISTRTIFNEVMKPGARPSEEVKTRHMTNKGGISSFAFGTSDPDNIYLTQLQNKLQYAEPTKMF